MADRVRRRRVGYGVTEMSDRQFGLNLMQLGLQAGGLANQIQGRRETGTYRKGMGIKAEAEADAIREKALRDKETYDYENEYVSIEPEDDLTTARLYENRAKSWVDRHIVGLVGSDIVKDQVSGKRTMKRNKRREWEKRVRTDPNILVPLATTKFQKSFGVVSTMPDYNDEKVREEYMRRADEAQQKGELGTEFSKDEATSVMNKRGLYRKKHQQNINEALGVAKKLTGAHKDILIGNYVRAMVKSKKPLSSEQFGDLIRQKVMEGHISEVDIPLFIGHRNRSLLAQRQEEVDAAGRDADIKKKILEAEQASFETRGIKGKTPVYSEEELKRLPRYAKGLKTKGQKPPYERGKRYKTTGPDGSPQEGTFQGMSKEGEPQFTNIRKVKEKGGKGRAGDRRQYRKKSTETFDYLMGLEDEISETGKLESAARRKKLYSLFLTKREKYREAGEDAETGAMLAMKDLLGKPPKEPTGWGASIRDAVYKFLGGTVNEEAESPATPGTAAAPGASQEAKDYGISESPEGTMMDNPETGETIVSRNGRWVSG